MTGVYQSSTGSTGTYEITGYQLAVTTPSLGQPVALAIEWHSIDEGPADPSWNWSSGLSGQLSVIDAEEVLELSHLLVASSDLPGLARQGTYVDKLIYRRTQTVAQRAPSNAPPQIHPAHNTLAGTWKAADGTRLKLSVETASQDRFGRVHGYLTTASEHTYVSGFTDINAAASDLPRQSLAITSVQTSSVVCLSGVLNLQDDVLELMIMTSVSTPPAQTYVQTQIAAVTFMRNAP